MDRKLNSLAARWCKLSSELRNRCIDYLKTALVNNNNRIDWKELNLPEYISVSYDGGNHPEYATNVYSNVYSIKWNTEAEEIVLDTEDSSDYPIYSVTTEELYNLCDFIDSYKKEIGWK